MNYVVSETFASKLEQLIASGAAPGQGVARGTAAPQVAIVDVGDFACWANGLPLYSATVARLDAGAVAWGNETGPCYLTERRSKSLTPGSSVMAIRSGVYSNRPVFITAAPCCGGSLSSSSSGGSGSGSGGGGGGGGAPCALCPDGPSYFTFTVSGLDGCTQDVNGDWTLTYDHTDAPDCYYTGTLGSATATLVIYSNSPLGWYLTFNGGDAQYILYEDDCCVPHVLERDHYDLCMAAPLTITITPHC